MIAGEKQAPQTRAFLRAIDSHFIPNKVVALHPLEKKEAAAIERLIPFLENQRPVKGQPAAYVCKNYVCQFPVTEVSELEKLL